MAATSPGCSTPPGPPAGRRARCSLTAISRWLDRLGSAGRPYACVEVMVADGEDRALPAGEAGEILCRGDVVMPGYWRNPDATAQTLRGGWLHTGDVGVLDTDGYLTLKDR